MLYIDIVYELICPKFLNFKTSNGQSQIYKIPFCPNRDHCTITGMAKVTSTGLENPRFTAVFAAGFFSTSSTKGCNRAVPSS